MEGEGGTEVEGSTSLGKEELSASGTAVESKGVVTRLGKVTSPDVETNVMGKQQTDVRTKGGIEGLGIGIRLVPICLAL